MNTENVVSLEAVSALAPFLRVKMTAAGLDLAGPNDRAIGITLPGDLNRTYPSVQVIGMYAEAVLGNGTDVVRGDELEAGAAGVLVKKTAGVGIAVAVTGATEAGDHFDVMYFRDPIPTAV